MAEKYSKDMTAEEKAARRQQRMDELQAQREANALQRALARAATKPEFNFTQRPAGFIDEGNKVIRYYGWNGGKETGKWVAREAPLTDYNYNKFKGLIPADEFVVKSLKASPRPARGDNSGFTVKPDGSIVPRGDVDTSVLNMKTDLNMEKVLGKRVEREDIALQNALARAQKSPMTNFLQRPAGRITGDTIYFYSWIGGKESGEWVLYSAERTQENMNKFVTRVDAQKYFTPTSIRDVLIPVTNAYGEDWNTALSKKKVVTQFNPENAAKVTLTGQIDRGTGE